MVSNFRGCPYLINAYIKLNRQHGRIICFNYQRKYLSNKVPDEIQQYFLKRKFYELVTWYDEFTGMDEVRAAQKRVLEDEERFRESQEERRRVLVELTEVQSKLKDVLSEIDSTNRGEERYVSLVTEEHKLIKEEKYVLEKFAQAEKLERESFAALSTSVKLSHEKERAQSERTKYWSIIGSVLGTVIGILGSSINNHFRMNELKQLIINSTNIHVLDSITSYLETNHKILEKLESYETEVKSDGTTSFVEIKSLLKSLCTRLTNVETSLKHLKEGSSNYASKSELSEEESVIVTVPVSSLEESLKKEYSQTKMLLFTLAVLSIIMPIISKYS